MDFSGIFTLALFLHVQGLAGGAQVLTGRNNRVLTGILGFPKGPPTPLRGLGGPNTKNRFLIVSYRGHCILSETFYLMKKY